MAGFFAIGLVLVLVNGGFKDIERVRAKWLYEARFKQFIGLETWDESNIYKDINCEFWDASNIPFFRHMRYEFSKLYGDNKLIPTPETEYKEYKYQKGAEDYAKLHPELIFFGLVSPAEWPARSNEKISKLQKREEPARINVESMNTHNISSNVHLKEGYDGIVTSTVHWESLVKKMDKTVVDAIHERYAPCGQVFFIKKYLEYAPNDMNICICDDRIHGFEQDEDIYLTIKDDK